MTFRPQTTDGQLQEATNIEQTSRIVPLIAQACFISPSFHHLHVMTHTFLESHLLSLFCLGFLCEETRFFSDSEDEKDPVGLEGSEEVERWRKKVSP